MKKLNLFFVAILFFAISANAQIITVDNNPNSGAMYDNLQTAIDAANEGDTLFVSGSNTSYGDITINKSLILIGSGYNTDNQYDFSTQINDLYFVNDADPTNPSNSLVIGFIMVGIFPSNNPNIDNITFKRNKIQSIYAGSSPKNNWQFVNNVINNIAIQDNYPNLVFRNNIIIIEQNGQIKAQGGSIIFTNNIIIGNKDAFWYTQYITFQNNIFYYCDLGVSSPYTDYCIFTNNISYGHANSSFSYGTNTATGNIEATDPLFVNTGTYSETYEYIDDYNVQGGSPAIGAGTDGTDIGIYGGLYPFPVGGNATYTTSPMPAIPQIMQMIINNSVVPEDGVIDIHIEGQVND